VARYHLVNRVQYVLLPCGVTAFTFLVNLVLFANVPAPRGGARTGAVLTIFLFFAILGAISAARPLSFGLALGLSRRSYYLGTILLVTGLAAAYALALALLQVAERATSGWWVAMHYFRVVWILDGPWYLTWLTSSILLVLLFVHGMWTGLVYRRWHLPGLTVFSAAQVTVLLAAVLAAAWTDSWLRIGRFFAGLTVTGLTGLLAAITAMLILGGYATIRRVTV
jgi:hypothetical protein